MIGEFELYHGVALRDLIVGAKHPIKIESHDDQGRVNSYRVNDAFGIHIKHSTKRLPPWQFTYPFENICEIEKLSAGCESVWLIHVCGQDGMVALSFAEFLSINPADIETTKFVRVDRDRNKMYRVNGTGSKLSHAKRRGLHSVFEDIQGKK